MHQTRRVLAFARCALLLALAAACSDEPLTPRQAPADADGPAFSAAGRSPRDVPAVRIDLPPAPRPWDTDPAELARAVGAVGGYATVGVKEPGSARALATGNRAAVTAGTVNAALQLLRQRGVEVLEVLDAIGAVRVRISPEDAAALRDHPLVDFIEPRQYAQLQAQSTPWGITMVRAPEAWALSTGAGAKILIIDTGHQQGHPDLPAVPSANCSGVYGGCNDSGIWHGTHVTGIATARNNTIGVVGVAPGIAPADVYVYGACDSASQSCPLDEVSAGINSGIFTAHVMNLSLGGTVYDATMASAVAQAWNNGIVIVAAAGNNLSNTTVYPAAYTNVVGVSGVNSNKTFAGSGTTGTTGYSNYGAHVDLAAPFCANSTIGGSSYGTLCGTSMASPHVAGAAALVKAEFPTWTNQQIVNRLFASAEDLGAVGRDNYFGNGLVDAYEALTYVTPVAVTISGPSSISTTGSYTWTATASGGNGTYTYQWQYRVQGSTTWTNVGTGGSTYTRSVDASDPDFELRVTATSAGSSGSDTHLVNVGLSASITGRMVILNEGGYTWTASVSGGSGSYTYKWEYRVQGGTTWAVVGSGSSYSRHVAMGDPSFELRLTVTSGGASAMATKSVAVNIQPDCGEFAC